PPNEAVMVAEPTLRLVTVPMAMPSLVALATEATVASELDHVARPVTSRVVASEYVAFAVRTWVIPSGNVAVLGVTARLVTIAAVPVTVADPATLPSLACRWAVPAERPGAGPFWPLALDTETAAPSVDHATDSVMSTIEPSE